METYYEADARRAKIILHDNYYARYHLGRVKTTPRNNTRIESVICAEHYIARLRAYQAAGFFRTGHYQRLHDLEAKLERAKNLPTVKVGLSL